MSALVKEINEVAVAVSKVAASLVLSFKDGKFSLITDGVNFIDDIPAILAAVDGGGLIKEEFKNLTQLERAFVKQTAIDTVLRDLGEATPDQETLYAVADIAEAALAIIFLISRSKKVETPVG